LMAYECEQHLDRPVACSVVPIPTVCRHRVSVI
jgi:hypothetical protein